MALCVGLIAAARAGTADGLVDGRGGDAGVEGRTNVVILFGDDWGFGDMGANHQDGAGLTPNLDKLAAGGIRFTDFHVGASVCTPSRAALLTGRLGLRTGVTHNFGPGSFFGLPRTETTLAELVKPKGWLVSRAATRFTTSPSNR